MSPSRWLTDGSAPQDSLATVISAVLFLVALLTASCGGDEQSASPTPPETVERAVTALGERSDAPIHHFTNVASEALRQGFEVWNDRPGVAVFDYDRDGDLDIYITAEAGHPNWLYRNDGDDGFTDVAEQAGVDALTTNSTGVAACDLDNDGFQDLYVGAWGNPRDGLGFRSPSEYQGNSDLLFRNNGDGTFSNITSHAFGNAVNIRSATTIACADVDNDGWLDIYVGNPGRRRLQRLRHRQPSRPLQPPVPQQRRPDL